MSQPELLKKAVAALDRLGIAYMVTGSTASSYQGDPRATHDIDLVVELQADQIASLAAEFPPPAYYLSESAMHDALAHGSMFNLLEVGEGDKVDFWLLRDDAFDQSRFARRLPALLTDFSVMFSSPEDTILQKLRWAQLSGGSEKQMLDAVGVYEVQHRALDHAYLQHWVATLGISDEWRELVSRASPIN